MIGPQVQVELQGPAEWDASLEARELEQVTARKIDGAVVTAAEANALIPAIDKAIGAGIPGITFDSDSPGSRRLASVGTNNYNAGWAAGKAMAEWLGGAGIKIAATVNDGGHVANAEAQITAMLHANPGITGTFCAHGNPGPGAAAAVRNLGLKGKVQIL